MSPNGRITASTDPGRDAGISIAEAQNWIHAVRQTDTMSVHQAAPMAEVEGAVAVGFSAPIRDRAGGFLGLVTSRMLLSTIASLLKQEGRLQSVSGRLYDLVLMDRNGSLLADTDQDGQPQELRGTAAPLSFIKATTEGASHGFVEEPHLRRHVPVLTGYANTQGYGGFHGIDWTVLVRMERDQVYAPIDRMVTIVGAIGVLVLAPLTVFGIWSSWQLGEESRALRRLHEDLQATVADLSRSNADLQQFAYVASHDLQEPLRMVASYTQLLAKRYRGKLDAEADEFIGYAVDGAVRMQQLIQDLLAYSRVNTHGRRFLPTDLEVVFAQALANVRRAVEESGAVVTHDPLPTISADDRQLVQLFQNLLSNAIKFRGAHPPRIHVSAVRDDGGWTFSVRDNGIGIDPAFADRIFILFQRLHTRADYPGTGIGLAICKKIVERHGGRIWVESRPGDGATFFFTLLHQSSQPVGNRQG